MTVVAGPVARIQPHRAASVPGTYTPLFEMICPTTAPYIVATVTATALNGSEPGMGTVRMQNQTFSSWTQMRIYGTQTVRMKMVTVTAGDLIQIAASPYFFGGAWEGSRVWVHEATVTLVSFDLPDTVPTFAPSRPPTQFAVAPGDAAGTTVVSYTRGETWDAPLLSTSWRFRPVGGDTWEELQASNAGAVVLPFLLDAHDWEVQGAQTTIGGRSAWGETVVWTFADLGVVVGGGGYGLTAYGQNYGS